MSAIEIMAAGDEDGWGDYDGLCTLFNLQIGNDAQKQNFRFVPSTSSFTTWLPLYERCFILVNSSSKYPLWPTTLDKCAEESGVGTYEGTQNIGFNGSFNRPSYTEFEGETLDLGSSLQPADLFGQSYFGVSGVAGLDWVSLQLAGNDSWYQALNHTPIFGLDTVLYMLPTLGLGFGQYVSGLGPAYTSFMNTVSDTFVIPSRSWGYTAGAHYGKSISPPCTCTFTV
jgi:hypothetical protein